jgi:hypothetical protein
MILVSPGFPFSSTNENVDCLYDIRPSSPDVCSLRILFKLFWVGDRDSYAGCSGGFLEIDGLRYCDCIVGLTVPSLFDDLGDGRHKVLRYRKEAGAGDSGGFLLEVFQEECTGRSPRRRQDNGDETISQNSQHYKNIPYYYDVDIGSSDTVDKHILGQGNINSSRTYNRQDKEANRSHDTYLNTKDNEEDPDDYATKIPYKMSNGMEKSGLYFSHHRNTIYRNKPGYSRKRNSDLEESNSSATDNDRKNIEHNLSRNIPHEDKTNVYIKSDAYSLNKYYSSLPQEDKTMNNSDKQFYKLNSLHESKSIADESNVSSANTENHFGNYMATQVPQNKHYNNFSTLTNTSSICDKVTSENITKYCKDINPDEGKQNISAFSNVRNIDLTSTPSNVSGNINFVLNRSKSVHAATGQQKGNHTATGSGLTQEVGARERRDVVYPQFTTDRLWSTGASGCRVWGFAQWLLRAKQYFWKKIPQLLCPLLPPFSGQRCQVFGQVAGWLQSPGHPRGYPNNLRLCYR